MTGSTRRGFLRATSLGAAVAAGSALTACSSTAAAPADTRAPTFVLVGGNSTPSFFWMPLVRELARRGRRAYPVELPGHGLDGDFLAAYQVPQDLAALARAPSTLGSVTLADYVDATAAAVRTVHEHGPVVLVGHSLGGATLSLVGNTVPDLISRLVYVSAVCCTALTSALECILAPENAQSLGLRITGAEVGDPATSGVTFTNFRTADPEYLASYRAATMAEADDSQFLAALNYFQQPTESATVSLEDARGQAETWGRIPRTFVRLTDDRMLTPPLADRMVADADDLTPGNRFEVHDVAASHLGIMLRAADLADVLVAGTPGGSRNPPVQAPVSPSERGRDRS